jgi:hypothetical protein
MLDPQTTVSIAEISQYLWNDAIPKQNVFFNGSIDPRKAQQLYMERKALQYGIEEGLVNGVGQYPVPLEGVTNYVYALCGSKIQVAIEILGTGGGGGNVIPGGGGNFSVYEYTTNGTQGAVTVYFPEAVGKRCINAFRQGNNIGTILTAGVPTGNQVVWNKDAASLTVAADVPFYNQEFVRVIVQQ